MSAFVLAFMIRALLIPLDTGLHFITLYPTTIAVFYILGIGPGLLITTLSATGAYFSFIAPQWSFALADRNYFIVVMYVIGSTLPALVIYQLQRYAFSLHETLKKLQDSDDRFNAFMNCNDFLSWMKDDQGRYIYMNKHYQSRLRLTDKNWFGKTELDLIPKNILKNSIKTDQQVLKTKQSINTEIFVNIPDSQQNCWLSTKFHFLDSTGRQYIGGIAVDISERKAAENKIERLAFYDSLTDLPNRRLLSDRLAHLLNVSARQSHIGALLFIDLDNFKSLNDTYGHSHGDQLLQQAANRLQRSVRKGDTLARFGGDEFVILIEDLNDDEIEASSQAEATAEKVLQILGQPYFIENKPHISTPSIGVTLFGDMEETIEGPLKRADLAMYQAKSAGKNTIRFFDPAIQAAMTKRTLLEADLRVAIPHQLQLHYQPQITDGELIGVEALLRWQHPKKGMISPMDFIPLAEDTGLILPIGRWVIETACIQQVQWQFSPSLCELSIAINVSARQFHKENFVAEILSILQTTGANPRRLKIELTESILVSNIEDISDKMRILRNKGIKFSLDDFGTGYSSLAYLKKLPLNQLKIDRSFIQDIPNNSNDTAIAKAIIALAKSLGLSVIAEGVETEEQRRFLALNGCTSFQGYLYGRPLPIMEFELYAEESLSTNG